MEKICKRIYIYIKYITELYIYIFIYITELLWCVQKLTEHVVNQLYVNFKKRTPNSGFLLK